MASSREPYRWRACSRYTAGERPQPPPGAAVYCPAHALVYCSLRPVPWAQAKIASTPSIPSRLSKGAEQNTLNLQPSAIRCSLRGSSSPPPRRVGMKIGEMKAFGTLFDEAQM